MNREDIIRMAREAELIYWHPNSASSDGVWWMDAGEPGDELEHFAALVAAAERKRLEATAWGASKKWIVEAIAAEREACAKVVLDDAWALTFQTFGQYRTALAATIRARGQA